MVTPFHADGSVNEEAAVALARHLLEQRLARAGGRRHDRRGGDADRRGAGPTSVRLIGGELGGEGRSSRARAPTTRATPSHLTEA